jgi:hypothetical protein
LELSESDSQELLIDIIVFVSFTTNYLLISVLILPLRLPSFHRSATALRSSEIGLDVGCQYPHRLEIFLWQRRPNAVYIRIIEQNPSCSVFSLGHNSSIAL